MAPRGAEGLLKGRKVFVVTGRGLVYGDSSPGKDMDFQAPYLRAMLAFLGLDDVTFIHLEGLKISPETGGRHAPARPPGHRRSPARRHRGLAPGISA